MFLHLVFFFTVDLTTLHPVPSSLSPSSKTPLLGHLDVYRNGSALLFWSQSTLAPMTIMGVDQNAITVLKIPQNGTLKNQRVNDDRFFRVPPG
ncbi:uncharacterized protein EDB93DRAFT_201320 [Suillus bovinus]|uniref:uncharacterized protein n=1 Tax=Suillus bovinus TaxID=48563 RepID=UPI001B863EE3|nr:uncharacterized protein EDB93DRAFT_201320 [Suillus bovinus]KAG2127643.1 hypothetical protein EDB93DRAFT_201320 [Suillus bovinus]